MRIRFSFVLMVLMLGLLGVSVSDVLAAPMIRVSPIWRPASELSSIDANGDGITDSADDIRYVAVDIYATVNVEFWAIGMVCTVNKAVLESYVENGDPNSPNDSEAVFMKGASWVSSTVQHSIDTVDADGKISFALSLAGEQNAPMGSNGIEETLHIASLRYRVREDLAAAGNSPFTCAANFLNRDGKKVMNADYVAPANLTISLGYNFTGNISYQGITTTPSNAQAINIACDDSDGDLSFDDVVTSANVSNGNFSVNNLRTQGRYDCTFTPSILNNAAIPGAIHLTGQTDFYLSTSSFALLPIILKNGNVDTATPSSISDIDNADLTMVTSNWNASAAVLTAPYMFGDATGDRKINEMDLAVVTGNFNRVQPYPANHVIYSFARDVSLSYNSHLWLGDMNNASIRPFAAINSRDYWPAVSPGGNRIAFVRNVGTNGNDSFALFTAPITNGVIGTATRISAANADYDAFAPSWSPDASQIAFVCSYNDLWADATNPRGDVCLISANGQNFRHPIFGAGSDRRFMKSRIQAAAWFNTSEFYFAYLDPDKPDTCSDRLCMANLQSLSIGAAGAIPTGSDMPYVRITPLGLTLFYRFDNGVGSFNIRYAQLSASGLPFGSYPNSTLGSIHEDVESGTFPSGSSINNNIAYYTVSLGSDPDILFYSHNLTTGDAGGRIWGTRVYNGSSTAPSWSSLFASTYTPSDIIGSPAFASGYHAALPNTAVYLP